MSLSKFCNTSSCLVRANDFIYLNTSGGPLCKSKTNVCRRTRRLPEAGVAFGFTGNAVSPTIVCLPRQNGIEETTMPLATIEFSSQSLQKRCGMTIILPDPSVKGPYFTLYQLHGLSDDHTMWTRQTSIERYVEGLPLVVVMPDGGRGWYTDALEGYAYESHIMKDTIGFIEKYFPVQKKRGARAIGGLSMGGYGAMKLALKHAGKFRSVVAHSSAFYITYKPIEDAERLRIFGGNAKGGDEDVFALAERLKPAECPAIAFDCGKSDELIDSSRALHRHMLKLKIKHSYKEFPGRHEWDYWDTRFPEALKFHRRNLGF